MKSLRLSFVLVLVFSVVTVFAVAQNKNDSLSVEQNGNSVVVSENFDGTYFKLNSDSVEIIGLGEAAEGTAEQGTVNGKKAAHLKIDADEGNVLFESLASGMTSVKTGDFDSLVSMSEEKELKNSRVTMNSKSGNISFAFTEQPEKVRFFTLKGPDRLVFDFIGIKGSMKSAKGARSANHPAGYRVVIEKEIPQYFTISRSKIYAFGTEGKKMFAAFKNQPAETAVAAAEPEKAEEIPVVEDRTEIKGLAFIGEEPEILKVKADKKLEISRNVNGQTIEITVKNAFIAKDKEQVIDATSLTGPVAELAVYNEKENVKIIAKMKSAKHDLKIEESEHGSDFVFNSAAEKVQGVAGYSEAQIVRLPQAAVAQEEGGEEEKGGAVNMEEEPVQYTGKKINLDFKEVDILDILRLMSDISKLNIIAGDDVKGTVTVRLVDIPWDEALDVILKSKSLGKERFGNIIRVATIRTMQREKEEELAKKNAQKKLEPVKVRLVPVNYAMADKLVPQIKELLTDRGTVSYDQRTNVLIVKDVEEILDKSEQLVDYLDTQTPQVLIEARIVEATSTAALGLGIQWGTNHTYTDANGHPTNAIFPYNLGVGANVAVPGPADPTGALGFTFGSVGMINDLNLTLNVMESDGKIKIVSSPKVATLDNKEAMIQQGTSIPITTRGTGGDVTTKYVDASLILKTTPHITADGSILLNIEINKSEPDWSNSNYLGEPSIIKKEAKTEILIKSGDTVVIGGVYTNLTSKTKRYVPLLGKIPVLGWLFKSEESRVERSELLIFLTPRIMNKVKSSIPLKTSEE
ncbi:type IV pilus secretin PilQ [bacterium]|jgi:type IV pilus assembly protein PilQ|nr:type IV pilus secretin PilQ [bacterium]